MLDHSELTKLIFGRLTWDAIPFNVPILLGTFIAVALGGLAIVAALTSTASGASCGAIGSPASITRRSASCTSYSDS